FLVFGTDGAGTKAGAVAATASPDASEGGSTAGFRAWREELRTGGGTASKTAGAAGPPQCSYGGGGLACAAPGTKATVLDPATGKSLWSAEGAVTESGGAAVATAPVRAGGLVFPAPGGGATLEALDPRTGEVRWDLDVSAYGGRVYLVGDSVLLVAGNGEVTARDAATGEERWRRSLSAEYFATLPSAGASGPVYAVARHSSAGGGGGTTVTAVDQATGKALWQHRFDEVLDPVDVSGTTLYLTESDNSTRTTALVRFDPPSAGSGTASGTARRVPLDFPLPDARAAVHDGTAYLLGYGGSLVALDTEGGKGELWRLETSVSLASRPVVSASGDRLYFGAADGRLIAVDTERATITGQTEPRLGGAKAAGGVVSSVPAPLLAGDAVIGAAPDGSVFAVSAEDPAGW
ncbi:PQQ-binding-like beta-propeller repeat protein, partial [Streptomyces sp. GC420]|uniref:outer membrane protein assembly factor BamB family protein n=1 Tax=Streptomyces sp. GC420 TaxID=2697568 RepID=UPI0014151682